MGDKAGYPGNMSTQIVAAQATSLVDQTKGSEAKPCRPLGMRLPRATVGRNHVQIYNNVTNIEADDDTYVPPASCGSSSRAALRAKDAPKYQRGAPLSLGGGGMFKGNSFPPFPTE